MSEFKMRNKPRKISSYLFKISALLLSLAYSVALTLLPMAPFKDRENYLLYASDSLIILARSFSEGYIQVLFNEPIWLILNIGLGSFLSPENVVRFIIFVSAFIVSLYILKFDKKHFLYLLAVLFIPLLIKNHIIHLRQGFAVSIFLLAWFSSGKNKFILFTLTPLIHSSFFIVLAVLVFSKCMSKARLSVGLQVLLYVIIATLMSLFLLQIAGSVGARQGEIYENTVNKVSGLGFIFWLGILAIFISDKKYFIEQHSFEVGIIILYLLTYFTLPVTGRVFESCIPLILIAGLKLKPYNRMIFIFSIISFSLLLWATRINSPGIGFYGA
jgi:hypothetical protein